ncbi:MAG: glycosyltransferase family 2 protein, partial [Ignavibacteriales bacterium]|nr:glycosyltransferase family 2 protein [Ignavibacteriales bacterium]
MEQENKNKPNQQDRKNPRKFYYTKRYKKPYPKTPEKRSTIIRTKFKKISIVIPLLDEEESLTPLTHEIIKICKGINVDYEIIFIDDGSKDKSLEIIRNLANRFHKVKYISFRKNYGKSAALHVGFKHITGDVVITMDADLQDDPNEIPNLLKKLEEGYDLVSGWKKKRYDPFIKRNTSKFFNFFTRVMTGVKLHDFNCGLKAYRSEVVKDIKIYGELHRYIPALAGWKGFRVGEIPVKHHPR